MHLATVDGGIVAIRQNTVFRVDEYKADGNSGDRIFMSLVRGAIRSITGWIGKYHAPGYRITTPVATIGIRGTDHETTVIEDTDGDEPGTYDMVNEGITVLKTQYGESEVTPEKFAFAPRYRAAAPFLLTRKPDFWAKRRLKIQERIEKHKESLRDRLEQIREERIEHLEKIHSERPAQAREKATTKEEHAKMRAARQEKAEQRRETRRKEARPRRAEKPNEPRIAAKSSSKRRRAASMKGQAARVNRSAARSIKEEIKDGQPSFANGYKYGSTVNSVPMTAIREIHKNRSISH